MADVPAMYPLLFEPIFKEKVWGGQRLNTHLEKTLPDDAAIGEAWELADLPASISDGRSVIRNGALAGMTLREAIDAHEPAILGGASRSGDGGFPLLIKYLDAADNLSVQVHPTETYVRDHPDCHLKSEAWYVIAADDGAVIYKGVKPGVTAEQFAADIQSGTVVDDLVAVPVQPGDCHYLPSGTCHALGAGVLVAEVQTPSDTTFRVYDWDRPEKRELHIEQALQCICFDESDAPGNAAAPPSPIETESLTTQRLVETPFFRIDRIRVDDATDMDVVTSGMPWIWMMLRGGCDVTSSDTGALRIGLGDTVLFPAALTDTTATFDPDTELLSVSLPNPLRGMIA